jgi:serine/threonine-protein kinase
MLGTPCYMAPEQATGEQAADHRSDIWSVGVILYECLSGTRPIEGENLPQVVTRLISAGIIPLERLAPELPHEVSALVTQMLSRERTRRPQSLVEIAKVLACYTKLRAPSFDPPSTDLYSTKSEPKPQSNLPRARVIGNRDADPQGATMLSAPPTGNSVEIARSEVRPRGRRGMLFGVALAALVLSVVALSALGVFHRIGQPNGSAASAPAPAATTATLPNDVVPSRAAAAADPVAAAVPSAKAERRTSTRPASAKKAPVRMTSPATGVKAETDEGTLFPGRK